MFKIKDERVNNRVANVSRLCEENSSLLYALYCNNYLNEIISENYYNSNKSKLVCVYIKEPKIVNFNSITKVTNTLYGFKDSVVELQLYIIFVYSDGSSRSYNNIYEFVEYRGYRAKSIEKLMEDYSFDKDKFISPLGMLYRYEQLMLRGHHLDSSLKFIRDCLIKDKHFEPFFVFNIETLEIFIKEFKDNKDREYVSLLKENSDLLNDFINKTKDENARNRLINLFNRFDSVFSFYKDIGFHPDENYKMFSFYKLELLKNKGFIYTNGLSAYYVTYKGSEVKTSCLYDLYKGTKVSDCIQVLNYFVNDDKSGMLELLKKNMDLRKSPFTDFSRFKREWDYHNIRRI